jgi:hypothetical protein
MTLHVTDEKLEVRFSTSEKVLGFLRDTDVPYSTVREVAVVANGLAAPTGVRAPGYSWPRSRKIGTWRRRGHKSLVDVRRDQPALRVSLVGHRFDELLVGSDDAERLAGEIRSRVSVTRRG